MDSTKEVVQKLAKLNIDPYVQTQPVQELDASHKTSPGQRPDLFGPAFQAGFQTQSGTQFSLSNDQQTKPEAITAPFTANTSTDPESPKNIVPLRKPFWNISRNLAESLSKGVNPRNSDDRPHTTSITKCRDRMRMGVVDFLRRDASKGGSSVGCKRRRDVMTAQGGPRGSVEEVLSVRV